MSSSWEFWLCDDSGRRITLLKELAFAAISRSTRGYGTVHLGLPYETYMQAVATVFQPDWRIDAWRSPEYAIPMRREGSYFLRKYNIYDREHDSVRMIEFYGRSPLDILRRWSVVNIIKPYFRKTAPIDDMMKTIVTESFISPVARVAPAREFSVDGNLSLGPSITKEFFGKVVLDILKELKDTSYTMNAASASNRRILFDVVEGAGLTNGFGYVFRTYADLRGTDRTSQMIFSVENGNLKAPAYEENYLDEVTEAQADTLVVDSPDTTLSRWNKILEYRAGTSKSATENMTTANQILSEKAKKISMNATFLNSPGGRSQPRSLYGVDWDLGDLVRVQYAGKNFNAEVEIVYLSVDENGAETVTGMNSVGLDL